MCWSPVFSNDNECSPWLIGAGEEAASSLDAAGMAYVAYLRPDCTLLAVHVVRGGLDLVAAVAADARAQLEPCQVLVGLAAELLHIAVSGRVAGQRPEEASPRRAAVARAILAANLDRPGFSEAYAAAAEWGDFIAPWYGVTLLDAWGGVVTDATEYRIRMDIPMSVPSSR